MKIQKYLSISDPFSGKLPDLPVLKRVFWPASAAETQLLANHLAKQLKGGEIIFLRGPIGSGKTTFVQGLAGAFGIQSVPVSASFSLIREYRSKNARIFHIDLFRLGLRDMDNIGFEKVLEDPGAIVAVEWPEAAEYIFPRERLEFEIELLSKDLRKIKVRATGGDEVRALKNLGEGYAKRK